MKDLSSPLARAWALAYVRRLLAEGITTGAASAELGRGFGTRGEPGFWLSHGTLSVPGTSTPENPAFPFDFATLAGEITGAGPQLTLF